MDSVSLLYNTSEEAVFNASEVYAPASSSYHCVHVSNLQRYNALLLPSTEHARRWAVTFTDFQVSVCYHRVMRSINLNLDLRCLDKLTLP